MQYIEIIKVPDIENPQYQETITIAKSNSLKLRIIKPIDISLADTGSMIYLNNLIADKALQIVDKFKVTPVRIVDRVPLKEYKDGLVVLCNPYARRYFPNDLNYKLPAVRYNHSSKLKNKILVFELKEFTHLAEFSQTRVSEDLLNDNILLQYIVKVNINLDSSDVRVYEYFVGDQNV